MRQLGRCLSLLLIVSLLTITPGWGYYHPERYSRGELNELVGPIALYPDPLLAQILPASTFVDQIEDAADFSRHRGAQRLIDGQDWDVSVKAVAHYPSILYMMADKPDWTTALGQAYIEEPYDVMDAVQRLRAQAYHLGYLYPTNHQDVIVRSGYIRIIPVQPRYIYAPRYDPQVVYVRRAPSRRDEITKDILIFGLGLLIGSWLDRDCDWDHHRVYYHGWRDGGWVHRSRPHVTINNVYVNNGFVNRPIRLNRNVVNRDIRPFRHELRGSVGHFRPPANITKPAHFRANIAGHGPRHQAPPRNLVRATPQMLHQNPAHMKAMAQRHNQAKPQHGRQQAQFHARGPSPKPQHQGRVSVGQGRHQNRPPAAHGQQHGKLVSGHGGPKMERRNPFAAGRARVSSPQRHNVKHVSGINRQGHNGTPSFRRVENRPASHRQRANGGGNRRLSGNRGGGHPQHSNGGGSRQFTSNRGGGHGQRNSGGGQRSGSNRNHGGRDRGHGNRH